MLAKRRVSPRKKVQTTKVAELSATKVAKATKVAELQAIKVAKATNIAELSATKVAKEPDYPKEIFTDPTESEHSSAIGSSQDSLEEDNRLAKHLKLDSDSLVDLWDQPKPATPHKLPRPSN